MMLPWPLNQRYDWLDVGGPDVGVAVCLLADVWGVQGGAAAHTPKSHLPHTPKKTSRCPLLWVLAFDVAS